MKYTPENLKTLLKKHGVSREDLAAFGQVSIRTVHSWCTKGGVKPSVWRGILGFLGELSDFEYPVAYSPALLGQMILAREEDIKKQSGWCLAAIRGYLMQAESKGLDWPQQLGEHPHKISDVLLIDETHVYCLINGKRGRSYLAIPAVVHGYSLECETADYLSERADKLHDMRDAARETRRHEILEKIRMYERQYAAAMENGREVAQIETALKALETVWIKAQ